MKISHRERKAHRVKKDRKELDADLRRLGMREGRKWKFDPRKTRKQYFIC